LKERWKDIDGYEGLYQVSDLGRIKSLKRNVIRNSDSYKKHKLSVRLKIRKPSKHSSGYLRISLSKKGVVKYYYVHVLVAKAFIGKKPKRNDVDHKDCNRENNKLSNLRYLDYKSNRGIKNKS
jgi:hypothetical protein